ncbi:MAG TPA: PAS domain-containing protein [Gaiellaceae bacterium]|nr:PAS domain-containing protein [Gaiellaceae bacterium]
MFGRDPEELVGRLYLEEYPEAEGSPFHEAYVRALATQRPAVLEERYAPWGRWFENRITRADASSACWRWSRR